MSEPNDQSSSTPSKSDTVSKDTDHNPGGPKSKKGWPSRIATIVILLAICGGVVWWIEWDSGRNAQAKNNQQQKQPLTVTVEAVTPTDVPVQLDYLGQTESSLIIDIRARVKGFIETRPFTEGSMVDKDQVLFTIEKDTFQAELDARQAQLAQAQANYDQAERQVNRYQPLVKDQAASQQELDDWKTAKAVAQANIKSAQAAIEQAKLDLSYTTIRSPIKGRIGRALQDVGNYVGTGDPSVQSKLATVEQLDPIYVTFQVSEDDLLQWQQLADDSNQLHVKAELINGQMYDKTGKLNFVDVRVDPATGTATVRAAFPNPDMKLRPGQFIRVHINGVQRHDVLTVPQKAVVQTPSSAMVFVVSPDSKAQPRPVKLGNWVKDRWIIQSGLAAGDKVVTNHMMQMRPGVPLKIADQSEASTDVPTDTNANP